MCSVTDQNDPACVPLIQRDPIDRGAVDLLVAVKGCEILLYDPAKLGKQLHRRLRRPTIGSCILGAVMLPNP